MWLRELRSRDPRKVHSVPSVHREKSHRNAEVRAPAEDRIPILQSPGTSGDSGQWLVGSYSPQKPPHPGDDV